MNRAPLLWLALALCLLALAERWVHRHLQGVSLLLAGDREVAVILYALPLLPGVVLHELSHAAAAFLLRVPMGRISLRPTLAGDQIRLGVVPVQKTGPVRASLIGLAPLLVGAGMILLLGYAVFGLGEAEPALVNLGRRELGAGVRRILGAQDAWVWSYVIFAVSNTMLPSRSDRRAWAPVALFLVVAAGIVWFAGYWPALAALLSEPVGVGLRWLATMTTLTVLVDLPFIAAIGLAELALSRVRGVSIRHGR